MATEVKRNVYCTQCRAEVEHVLGRDKNNEIVATCTCGHSVKFPMTGTLSELDALILAHKKVNSSQVPIEIAAAQQAKADDDFLSLMGIKAN